MSNVEKLKKRAADFEAKRQIDKAIATYLELFRFWDTDDREVDVALYNRAGDLLIREGNVGDAMSVWEKAVDHYSEGGFQNNAIALCNKILRHSPGRASIYYKLGKISAQKGFKADAKKNFLEYADRMQKAQQIDEAFRALKEFADLCPDEDDIRQMLAEQLAKLGRNAEAIEQLQVLYERYESTGASAAAAATVDRIHAIDPTVEPKRSGPRHSRETTGLVFIDLDAPPRPMRKSTISSIPSAPPSAPVPEHRRKSAVAGLPLIDMDDEPAEKVAAVEGLQTPVVEPPPEPQPVVADISFGASFGTEETSIGSGPPMLDIEPTAFDSGLIGDEGSSAALASPEDSSFGTVEMGGFGTEAPVEPESIEPMAPMEPIAFDLANAVEEPPQAPPPVPRATPAEIRASLSGLPLLELTPMFVEAIPDPGIAEAAPISETAFVDDIVIETPAEAPAEPAAELEPEADVLAEAEIVPPVDAAIEASVEALAEGLADAPPDPVADAPQRRGTRSTMSVMAQSVDMLRDRVTHDHVNWQLHRELGEALLEDGDREGGLDELENAMVGFERDDDLESARSLADEIIRLNPHSVRHHQKRVEYAFRMADRPRLIEAYVELADALFRSGQAEKSKAVYQRVLELAPDDIRAQAALSAFVDEVAPEPEAPAAPPADARRSQTRRYTAETPVQAVRAVPPAPAPAAPAPETDFISLEDWLTEDEGPKSTRMVVDEEEPSGDEDADFNDMLRKFKQGVAQNVDEEDHESHYDLGIAYKEMGLVEEAIAEFQKALRGSQHRVRTYEALGQCFVERGQEQVATSILKSALAEPGASDTQLIGVLYLLGAASEVLKQPADAVKYYQRVFAVDINFRDVQKRMRAIENAL